MNDPIITLDSLAIGYDGRAVLSGISLSIERGSFTAILGANGSGKSTLLKTLLGLQPPVAGKIEIAAPPSLVMCRKRLNSTHSFCSPDLRLR